MSINRFSTLTVATGLFCGLATDAFGQSDVLSLDVDRRTGETQIINRFSATVQMNGYSIQSPASSLDPAGWLSLEQQGIDGWQEVGTVDVSLLAELNPTSNSTLMPFDSLNLGMAYNPLAGAEDLFFEYVDLNEPGVVLRGSVEYVPEPSATMLTILGVCGAAALRFR